jgi:hypothetical protein
MSIGVRYTAWQLNDRAARDIRRSERLVLILQCRLAGTPDWQICHDRMAA